MIKSKIVQIKNEWFVDLLVATNCWKNHAVCKSEDEAMRSIRDLRLRWGIAFAGIERDASFRPKVLSAARKGTGQSV